MKQIRVLIVDDAAAVRRLVTMALSNDPAIEVVGTAENGRAALDEIPRVTPDVVVLDVEMPVMDGIETLIEVRRRHPQLVVIMFSAFTQDGAVLTLEALRLGAADYLTKPTLSGGAREAIQSIGEQLTRKIKALCPQKPSAQTVEPDFKPTSAVSSAPPHAGRIDIVAVGASVGGPAALRTVIERLPADFPVPIVVVQHMPPIFTKQFANTLADVCEVSVYEAQTGQELRPATAWIAPGDSHMVLVRKGDRVAIRTHQKPPVHSCRPAVDELFHSVAKLYRSRALALVLTGMGQDGLSGCRAITEAGGQVWVQDESSSVVWGMPGCVAKACLAHRILTLDQIADELIRAVSVGKPSPHVVPVPPVSHLE